MNNDPSSSEGEQINEIYASVAPPIVKCLTFNMNHPTTGGDRNHKYLEHTQSTSVVKVNDPKPKDKDTECVQIISGVTKYTNSSINNDTKNPFFTGSIQGLELATLLDKNKVEKPIPKPKTSIYGRVIKNYNSMLTVSNKIETKDKLKMTSGVTEVSEVDANIHEIKCLDSESSESENQKPLTIDTNVTTNKLNIKVTMNSESCVADYSDSESKNQKYPDIVPYIPECKIKQS